MYLFEFSGGYIETIFFILLINSILVIKLRQTEGFGNSEKWIISLINFGNLCCIFDAACLIANGYAGQRTFFILNALFFVSYSIAMYLLFRYMLFHYQLKDAKSKRIDFIISIPLVFLSLLTICSYWTGWAFSVDKAGIYSRGPFYYIYFSLGELYVIGIAVIAVIHFFKNRRNDPKSIQAIIFALPLISGPLLQNLLPYLPITNMGLCFSLIFIFLNYQEVLIRKGYFRTQFLAALSKDYEAIHIADLDKGTFDTIKTSSGMDRYEIDNHQMPFEEMTQSLINIFVAPDEREDFLEFLKIDSLIKRMEKEEQFVYRYSIMADESENYCYEMKFVRASENSKKHILVIGTKCIDDILQMEREQGQYNAALLHDCKYFYEFDVTDGKLRNEFRTNDDYHPFYDLDIQFPIKYDDFNRIRTEKLGFVAASETEAEYWTCKGLYNAFEKGKRTVEIRYSSEPLNVHFTATIVLTEDSSSHHLHAVYVCKDLTEVVLQEKKYQQDLEKALIEAKKANRAKSDFLSRMSHDIRTPLNGIIGIMDINDKHSDDTEFVRVNRKKARVAADHLLSLVNDILDMSKFENEETELIKEPVNLFSLFTDTLTICAIRSNESGITLHHDGGSNMIYPDVWGSKLHIKQIFMNILNNCVKYNKTGGEIFCSVEMSSNDKDHVTYVFQIQDTGIGMSQEYIQHIFEPFSQEKNDARSRYQGSGMGMAIVKALVEKMGGNIQVESELGVGSTFKITIPFEINHNPQKEEYKEVLSNDVSLNGKRILIAEDNELNMEIAQIILEDAGVIVTKAVDGQEVYDIFINKPAGSFDAILMDIMMPKLDGYAATRKIRNSNKADADTIPIIAMSANAFEEDRKAAMDSGMNDHIPKPFKISDLYETVLKLMEKTI